MQDKKLLEYLHNLHEIDRNRILEEQTYHLLKGGSYKELVELLSKYDFIEAKVWFGKLPTLIEDYDSTVTGLRDKVLPTADRDSEKYQKISHVIAFLTAVRGSLKLRSGILLNNPEQLAPQLWAVLCNLKHQQRDNVLLQALLSRAAENQTVWLRPIWSSIEPKGKALLAEHGADFTHVTIIEDKKMVVTASSIGQLTAWDLEKGHKLFDFISPYQYIPHCHTDVMMGLDYCPINKVLISVDDRSHVRFWDVDNGELISGSFLGTPSEISPEMLLTTFTMLHGKAIFAVGYNTAVFLVFSFQLDQEQEYELYCIGGMQLNLNREKLHSRVESIIISNSLDIFATAGQRNFHFIYDTNKNIFVRPPKSGNSFSRKSMPSAIRDCWVVYFSQDKVHFANALDDSFSFSYVFPVSSTYESSKKYSYPIKIAFSDNNDIAALGFTNGEIIVISLSAREKVRLFKAYPDTSIIGLSIASNGMYCASFSMDKLRIWDLHFAEEETAFTKPATNFDHIGNFDFNARSDARDGIFISNSLNQKFSKSGSTIWKVLPGKLSIDEQARPVGFLATKGLNTVFKDAGYHLISYLVDGFDVLSIDNHPAGSYPRQLYESDKRLRKLAVSADGRFAYCYVEKDNLSEKVIEVRHAIKKSFLCRLVGRNLIKVIPYKHHGLVLGIQPFYCTNEKLLLWSDDAQLMDCDLKKKRITIIQDMSNTLDRLSMKILFRFHAQKHFDGALFSFVIFKNTSMEPKFTLGIDIWIYCRTICKYQKETIVLADNTLNSEARISNALMSKDARWLVTFIDDGTIRIWDMRKAAVISEDEFASLDKFVFSRNTKSVPMVYKFHGLKSFDTSAMSPEASLLAARDTSDASYIFRFVAPWQA